MTDFWTTADEMPALTGAYVLAINLFASRALALSTAARTKQSLPSRATDVAPNFPTRKRPTAPGESELTRASSRSFMTASSGRGQSTAFVMRLRPFRPVTARARGYCFL